MDSEQDTITRFNTAKESFNRGDYTPIIKLLYDIRNNNLIIPPQEENRTLYFKLITLVWYLKNEKKDGDVFNKKVFNFNVDIVKSEDSILLKGGKAPIATIYINEIMNKKNIDELILSQRQKNNKTQAIEVYINNIFEELKNNDFNEIRNIIKSYIKDFSKGDIGKYSYRFIKTPSPGRHTFFADPNVIKKEVNGVCSRNISTLNVLDWGGNAASISKVNFLFLKHNGERIIEDIMKQGDYCKWLLADDSEINIDISAMFIPTRGNNIPKGFSSVYFPIGDNYILLTPVVSAEMQVAINKKENSFPNIRSLKRGGSNTSNGGFICSKLDGNLDGNHIHLDGMVPSTLNQENTLKVQYENGRNIFSNKYGYKSKDKYSIHSVWKMIDQITSSLQQLEDRAELDNRQIERLKRLIYNFTLMAIEPFILFEDDYHIPTREVINDKNETHIEYYKPPRMNDKVFLLLVEMKKPGSYTDAISILLDELEEKMPQTLHGGFLKTLFRQSAEQAIRELI